MVAPERLRAEPVTAAIQAMGNECTGARVVVVLALVRVHRPPLNVWTSEFVAVPTLAVAAGAPIRLWLVQAAERLRLKQLRKGMSYTKQLSFSLLACSN